MCLCVCGFTRYNHSQYPVIRPCWKVPPFLDDFPFGFHPRLKVIHFRPLLITLKITIPPFSWLLFPYVFPHKTTYVWDFCPVFWHLSIFCTVGTWFIIVPMTPTARKGKPDERAAFHAPLDPHGCWGHVYLKMGFGDINGIWMVLYIYIEPTFKGYIHQLDMCDIWVYLNGGFSSCQIQNGYLAPFNWPKVRWTQ